MIQQPEFLTVGHVARDVQDDGSFTLGGTVTFAAQTAYHLGLTAAIVTCADPEVAQLLPEALPGIALQISPTEQSTTFANHYQDGFRTQYLYARAPDLSLQDIPSTWCECARIVLFGPLAQELSSDMIKQFARQPGMLLAATPQGWLRQWDATGRVSPVLWQDAEQLLPALDVLILSHDDLLPFADGNRAAADKLLVDWSLLVPLLVATDGRHGATLFQHGQMRHFSAYPAQEVDPTGAGDVFAAAFLTHLDRHHDPAQAVDFANYVAALSIEKPGILGIPHRSQLKDF
ncbi:PfkB family carbohydrate kinase [Dictyobacter arantiisoli]|uniref:Ribokinase n=1 Tax=Dictyobacter arantiisoli TaxID=2014874 RepID=A0A5A5T5R9_9CHLR|nr:PfkB family carbohydrate kinase [Dictyobacter arantiisoli]GCF06565.1 ribokinase [Dictyobacter arantiisoli]